LIVETSSLLIVVSGPSGVGKDAVLAGWRKRGCRCHFAVTATTRPRRERERDGTEYHFVSRETFQEMVRKEELLEWAEVYGNWYGVPRHEVKKALQHGDVVVKVDVQGAATIKHIAPQAVLIFIAPPSMGELMLRLQQRQSESPGDIKRRIAMAGEEMKQLPLFDYIVVNDTVDEAIARIEAIVIAEKCRVEPRVVKL